MEVIGLLPQSGSSFFGFDETHHSRYHVCDVLGNHLIKVTPINITQCNFQNPTYA